MENVFVKSAVDSLEEAMRALEKIDWEVLDAESSNALHRAKDCIAEALDCLEDEE